LAGHHHHLFGWGRSAAAHHSGSDMMMRQEGEEQTASDDSALEDGLTSCSDVNKINKWEASDRMAHQVSLKNKKFLLSRNLKIVNYNTDYRLREQNYKLRGESINHEFYIEIDIKY
jgi:hypothetical protein